MSTSKMPIVDCDDTRQPRWTSEIRIEKSFVKMNQPMVFSPQMK
jgi:hypothetical protein